MSDENNTPNENNEENENTNSSKKTLSVEQKIDKMNDYQKKYNSLNCKQVISEINGKTEAKKTVIKKPF